MRAWGRAGLREYGLAHPERRRTDLPCLTLATPHWTDMERTSFAVGGRYVGNAYGSSSSNVL